MLQMLSEVVRAEKLLGVVTLPKLVNIDQVLHPCTPVMLSNLSSLMSVLKDYIAAAREFFAAVTAGISLAWRSLGHMERVTEVREGSARP